MSLRFRLTFFYSAFFAVILTAIAFVVYALTERSLTSSLEERGRQALQDLGEGNINQGLSRLPGDAYYEIVLYPLGAPGSAAEFADGLRYSEFQSVPRINPTEDDLPSLLDETALERLYEEGYVSTRVSLQNGDSLFVLADRGTGKVRFLQREAAYPATLYIGIPAGSVAATLRQLAKNLGLTVVSAFLAFAAGVWILSRQVLSPVQRVTRAASRVTGKDLTRRVPVPKTKDEMKELAMSLNRMLDRLQESFETQRRFTADASHELRTPVTAIVGHANYLLRRTEPKVEQVDSLTVIRREAERMAKLVNDLLELARADAGISVEKEPVNLIEVVEAVHMDVAPVAGSTEIRIDAAVPRIEVVGDPGRLKQVVLNLVQNAINAGASEVRISVTRGRDGVRLEVLDNGSGIPESAIPHLFDRFYRVDDSRSARGKGSGLGLAIVRWIVQEHSGKVTVESKVGEGTVFTIHLPEVPTHPAESNFKQTLTGTLNIFRPTRAGPARE